MSTKYLRDVSLVLNGGALVIRDLKVSFNVSKSLSAENNSASFQIWNLTAANRSRFKQEFREVEFYAGYTPPQGGSNVGLIFKGFLRDVEHNDDETEIITSIECGDGDKGTRKGTVAKTHPTGTKPKTIIDDVVNEMPEITPGEMKGLDDLPASLRPVVTMGGGVRELDKLARSGKFYWTINNGQLETMGEKDTIGATTIISQQTGMLGVPSVTDKGVNVEVLLEPQIAPGRQIDIRSETVEMNDAGGLLRAHNVTFSGDNRNGDFKVAIEAVRIS